MYLFFLQREKACRRARALSRAGRDLLLALCFGFPPVLIQPPRGASGCPAARSWRVWKGRRQPFWLLGRHIPKSLDHLLPKFCLHILQAQLVWHSEAAIVSLVTHSHQTSLELLEKMGSRDIFSFIPVVKHFVFISWFAHIPGSWWKRPSAGRGWAGQHSALHSRAPMNPQTRSSPELAGSLSSLCSSTGEVISDSMDKHSQVSSRGHSHPCWDPGGSTKGTSVSGRAGEQERQLEGMLQGGEDGMQVIQDGPGPCRPSLKCFHLFCVTSHLHSFHWRGEGGWG